MQSKKSGKKAEKLMELATSFGSMIWVFVSPLPQNSLIGILTMIKQDGVGRGAFGGRLGHEDGISSLSKRSHRTL